MHITLAFLGWVADDRVGPATDAAGAAAAGHAPFDLTFDHAGRFPSTGARGPLARGRGGKGRGRGWRLTSPGSSKPGHSRWTTGGSRRTSRLPGSGSRRAARSLGPLPRRSVPWWSPSSGCASIASPSSRASCRPTGRATPRAPRR